LIDKSKLVKIGDRLDFGPRPLSLWMERPMDKPKNECGYRGASYWVYKGRKYITRTSAIPGDGPTATSQDGHYNGDYYYVGILPAVGTIMADDSAYFHDFPPAEVCAHFPDFTPARWTADWKIEYQGEPPQTTNLGGEKFYHGGRIVATKPWLHNFEGSLRNYIRTNFEFRNDTTRFPSKEFATWGLRYRYYCKLNIAELRKLLGKPQKRRPRPARYSRPAILAS
jgi:hypothetical protein